VTLPARQGPGAEKAFLAGRRDREADLDGQLHGRLAEEIGAAIRRP
jgi:hypothetical protein